MFFASVFRLGTAILQNHLFLNDIAELSWEKSEHDVRISSGRVLRKLWSTNR